MLPTDLKTLKLLYEESLFWKLESLKQAIENRHVHVHLNVKASKKSKDEAQKQVDKNWWNEPPAWWGKEEIAAANEASQEKHEKKGVSSLKEDLWWMGKTYNGIDYAKPIEAPQTKSRTKAKKGNLSYQVNSTWTRNKFYK